MSLTDLYLAGGHAEAWDRLATEVFQDPARASGPQAEHLARLTFQRVARNVDRLVSALRRIGYRFECETPRYGPASLPRQPAAPETLARLRSADWPGPWPLALGAFAEHVGTVDLRQSFAPEAHASSDPVIAWLGDWDPLVFDADYMVHDIDERLSDPDDPDEHPSMIRARFAPDIFHKANISGADGYTLDLPDIAPDPPIVPNWSEYLPSRQSVLFLAYLRECLSRGGFYGAQALIYDRGHGWLGQVEVAPGLFLPDHPIFEELAAGLEPF